MHDTADVWAKVHLIGLYRGVYRKLNKTYHRSL